MSTPEQREALKSLRETFPKGSTVYTILRSRSRSGGTSRVTVMGLRAVRDNTGVRRGAALFPNHAVGVTLGLRAGQWEGHDVVTLPGFTPQGWIAEQLSRALYGDPTALTERAI